MMTRTKRVGAENAMTTDDPSIPTAIPIDVTDADPATDTTDTKDAALARLGTHGGDPEAKTTRVNEAGKADVDDRATGREIHAAKETKKTKKSKL